MIEPIERIEDPNTDICAFCEALLVEVGDPDGFQSTGVCDAVCSAKFHMRQMEKADFKRPVHVDYMELFNTYKALVEEVETLRKLPRFTKEEAAWIASGILHEIALTGKLGIEPLPEALSSVLTKTNNLLAAR